jgi:hypothetical protein
MNKFNTHLREALTRLNRCFLGLMLGFSIYFTLLIGNASFATAAGTQIVSAIDSGWYRQRPGGYLHLPSNTNFIVGHSSLSPTEYRDFFVFDLSFVTRPIKQAFFQADLTILTEVTNEKPVKSWTLYDVTTSISELRSAAAPAATFSDLGSGESFGEFQFPLGSGPTVTVKLNSTAIAMMNNVSGLWAFGGSVNNTPEMYDILFDSSGLVESHPRLVLSIPEPRSVWLACLIVCIFIGRRIHAS